MITDAYDGYHERKYNQEKTEGKFLVPVADKILVSAAFISFSLLVIIDFWMVGLIIFRDFFVTVRLFIGSSCCFKTSVAYKLQSDLQQIY